MALGTRLVNVRKALNYQATAMAGYWSMYNGKYFERSIKNNLIRIPLVDSQDISNIITMNEGYRMF
jgi:hypothetical protein